MVVTDGALGKTRCVAQSQRARLLSLTSALAERYSVGSGLVHHTRFGHVDSCQEVKTRMALLPNLAGQNVKLMLHEAGSPEQGHPVYNMKSNILVHGRHRMPRGSRVGAGVLYVFVGPYEKAGGVWSIQGPRIEAQ